MVSHDLRIREGQFATPQDFDPTLKLSLLPQCPESPAAPKPIYDMIEVQSQPKVVEYESHIAAELTNENPTFEEAINSPKKDEWIQAMKEEISSIRQNETWRLVKLPHGRKPIGVKWVLNVKRDAKGNITKHNGTISSKRVFPAIWIRL
jgi:hypothetical protein